MDSTTTRPQSLAASARRGAYETVPYRRPCSGCGTPKPLHALTRLRQQSGVRFLCTDCHAAQLAREQPIAERPAAAQTDGPVVVVQGPIRCTNCGGLGGPLTRDRCRACFRFWQWHGYEREVPQ